MLENLFKMFEVTKLVDSEFHKYLYKCISDGQNIANRKKMAKILGGKLIAPLIKNKTYRKDFTDYIDILRKSKTFRDR
jgi:hypothetical protein